MVNVAVAPCSPFSVSRDLMRESARLARSFKGQGVRLHTHLAENDHDIAYSREKFNCTPAEYAQDLGWLGPDVWHAHCVKLDDAGISLFAASRTGVAHCPCSNMRLASGIAPVRRMLDAGVPVGLGVDGSASNDAAHMVSEARQALLLARVGRALQPPEIRTGADGASRSFFGCDLGPAEMTVRDALSLATRGGAEVLGRSDIGHLAPGLCADLALFDLRTLGFAGGAVHDPVGALAAVRQPAGGVHRGQRAGGGARGAPGHAGTRTAGGTPQPAGPGTGRVTHRLNRASIPPRRPGRALQVMNARAREQPANPPARQADERPGDRIS